jgi:hypothetical protein
MDVKPVPFHAGVVIVVQVKLDGIQAIDAGVDTAESPVGFCAFPDSGRQGISGVRSDIAIL